MSVLQYPEPINAHNLQIYDNAAFDDAADSSSTIKDSWVPLQPISLNRPGKSESDSSKENCSPTLCKSPVFAKSQQPTKRMSQGKPLKVLFKQGLLSSPPPAEPSKIDDEIEEIEREISRLASRLEALKIEKARHDLKTTRRQSVGRIVPAKFMEQKQSTKIQAPPPKKKTQESPASFRRRGVSLGPSEISSAVRSSKPDNRRKSCFWKLPEIGEEEGGGERERKGGRSLSLSPKSRPSIRKTADPRRGISTVGSKKPVKRDQSMLIGLQPRTLFGEEKSAAASNRAPKNSRVVPSRYSQANLQQTSESGRRKTRCNLSSSSVRTPAPETKAKRKWDIPVQVKRKPSPEDSPSAILRMAEELPKIRTVRCRSPCPRDSGPAKRVADLIGRKSYFDAGDGQEEAEEEKSVRQVLQFEEEEEQEEQ